MKYCRVKTVLILFVMALSSHNAYAITKENERMAKRLIENYYKLLQEYANSPNNPKKQKEIANLFTDPNGKDVCVINDLLLLRGDSEAEADLRYYLSTIDNLWNRESNKLSFSYRIDEKSMKEQPVSTLNDNNISVSFTNIWVWVNKTITAKGRSIETKETFKIVNGKIETITTPEKASYQICGIDLFNQKKYKKAFEAFESIIHLGKGKPQDYYLAGLLLYLKKAGTKYPKNVRDVMTLHYWAKTNHPRIFREIVLAYSALPSGYNEIDLFKESREWSFNEPESCGLIRIGKKNKYGNYEFCYTDNKGKVKISYKFSEAHRFTKEGVALVKNMKTNRYGIINTNGDYITKHEYIDAIPIHNRENSQLFAVKNENGKWGYINYKGQEVIPFEFKEASNFRDGFALVMKDKTQIVINDKGIIMDAIPDSIVDKNIHFDAITPDDYEWGTKDLVVFIKERPSFEYYYYKYKNTNISNTNSSQNYKITH